MFDFLAQATPPVFRESESVFSGTWWQKLTEKESWQIMSPLMAITIASILTIGIYTLLYRENKFYRLVEHIFVGLAAGFTVVAAWAEVLEPLWFRPMTGLAPDAVMAMEYSRWAWAILLPVGFLGLFIFSRKNSWLGRIPVGIIIGLWSGQQFSSFQEESLPQLADTARSVIPNKMAFFDPSDPPGTLNLSQAISNLVLVITFIVVLSYFLYSFEQKNKLIQKSSTAGRWLLMVGLGAIFGTTMMTRFILFIDRAYFLLIEWLKLGPPS